jgi:hypothetical protein
LSAYKIIIIILVAALGVITLIATLVIRADKKAERIHAERWRRLLADGFSPDKIYKRLATVASTGSKFFYNYLAFDLKKALCALEYRVFSIKDAVRVEMLNDTTVVQSAASKFGGAGLLGVVVPGVAGLRRRFSVAQRGESRRRGRARHAGQSAFSFGDAAVFVRRFRQGVGTVPAGDVKCLRGLRHHRRLYTPARYAKK